VLALDSPKGRFSLVTSIQERLSLLCDPLGSLLVLRLAVACEDRQSTLGFRPSGDRLGYVMKRSGGVIYSLRLHEEATAVRRPVQD
jgi:hypothetical protein